MTQETINRLMELKQLLEAGILTPEEVEAEKKKILNPQQVQPVNEPAPEPEQPTEPEEEDVAIEEEAMPIMQDSEGCFIFEQPKVEQQYAPESTNPVDNNQDEDDVEDDDKFRKCMLALIVVLLIIIIIFACASQCKGSSHSESYEDEVPVDSIDSVAVDDVEDYTTYTTYEDGSDGDDEFADDPWSRTFTIDGGIYRLCDTRTRLSLQKESGDLYSGDIVILCGEIDEEHDRFWDWKGSITGSVRGKRVGNQITIVIDNFNAQSGSDGDYASGVLKRGQQILKLTYDGYSYSATAIGNMDSFFDGYGPNVIN